VIAPASSTSISLSRSSEDAPDGCCQVNIKTEDAASSMPRHFGAASPRRVDGAVMLESLAAWIRDDSSCRECNSMIASAEHDVNVPKMIPADSRIRDAGVSFEEPRDWAEVDFNTPSATSITISSLMKLRDLVNVAGAPFLSIPSSYFPPAHDFPISPTARTVAARVSIAIFRSSIGRVARPFSRTSDSKAGKQLPLAISIAASRQAPKPDWSVR